MNVVELLGHPATRPHLVVVIGKGGVGKTTISILFSLELCKHGKTLLLSLDPARHMSKYLNMGDRDYVVVLENLHVKQVSVDKEIAELTSKYADLLRDLMPSLAVLNIDNVVDTIRYSPGVEEEIFLKVMLEALRENYDFVVVDTPPTGITLRTLMLPRLYLAWLEKLIEVRERIVSLRYVIARALG
ncbi:MAG: ArsA-related P-loop ATPase, partial [Nitrososphaerota archaeon]